MLFARSRTFSPQVPSLWQLLTYENSWFRTGFCAALRAGTLGSSDPQELGNLRHIAQSLSASVYPSVKGASHGAPLTVKQCPGIPQRGPSSWRMCGGHPLGAAIVVSTQEGCRRSVSGVHTNSLSHQLTSSFLYSSLQNVFSKKLLSGDKYRFS